MSAWKPGMPAPPWSAQNERQKKEMRDWVFYQLENFYRAHRAELFSEYTDSATIMEQDALEDARSGDVTKLRRLAKPAWRPYINPPPLGRGEKYPRRPTYSSTEHYDDSAKVRIAKLALPLIRKIWRKHYGKSRRVYEDGYDAYDIAAAYFGIEDVNEVAKKAPGKRTKKKRDK
jgi:hypothetical protein